MVVIKKKAPPPSERTTSSATTASSSSAQQGTSSAAGPVDMPSILFQIANLSPDIAQVLQMQIGNKGLPVGAANNTSTNNNVAAAVNNNNNNNSRSNLPVQQMMNPGPQKVAAMEDISRLGDSSSATSSSDGSAVKIPCRARGMPLDHTMEVRAVVVVFSY